MLIIARYDEVLSLKASKLDTVELRNDVASSVEQMTHLVDEAKRQVAETKTQQLQVKSEQKKVRSEMSELMKKTQRLTDLQKELVESLQDFKSAEYRINQKISIDDFEQQIQRRASKEVVDAIEQNTCFLNSQFRAMIVILYESLRLQQPKSDETN